MDNKFSDKSLTIRYMNDLVLYARKMPDSLINALRYYTTSTGVQMAATMLDFPESICDEDEEWLKGRKFEGVCLSCEYEDEPEFLSYQEFYDILSEYVEEAIKDMGEDYKSTARQHLKTFKEKYNLIDNDSLSSESKNVEADKATSLPKEK